MKRFRLMIGLFLILLAAIPGSVQAAPIQTDDPALALLDQALPGVNFDPQTQSWYFYGVPVQLVRYEMPGAGVDLVRVLFRSADNSIRQVWVATGVALVGNTVYLPRGDWQDADQMQANMVLRQTLLKVYVSETSGSLRPVTNTAGISWSNCTSGETCEYGRMFDDVHHDLSNGFITSEVAPGWYPWGFLFWDIEIANPTSHAVAHPTVLSGAQ